MAFLAANPINITKSRGTGDIFDNIDDLCEVIAYANKKGEEVLGHALRLNFDPGPFPAAVTTANQDSK